MGGGQGTVVGLFILILGALVFAYFLFGNNFRMWQEKRRKEKEKK
jgi:hypothetical protein